MSRRALVLDGLWYSLCPSFTRLALSRPSPLLKPRRCSKLRSPPTIRIATPTSRRHYSSEARKPVERFDIVVDTSVSENLQHAPPDSDPRSPSDEYPSNRWNTSTTSHLPVPKAYMGLESKSESELETLLQSDKSAGFFTTARVLRELIRDRHVEPRARHYKALILANADASCGKPSAVRSLLQEMEDNNIAADSGTLHAALQVRYCW